LPHIHRRHLPAKLTEAPFDVPQDFVAQIQLSAKEIGKGLARQVVFRRTQPARSDHQFDAIERFFERRA
jgi:hypothetical protein